MMRAITRVCVVLASALCSAAAYAEPIPITRVLAFTEGGVQFRESDVVFMSFGGSGAGFSLGMSAETGKPSTPTGPTMNPSFVVQSSAPRHVGAVLRLADGQTIPLHGGSPTLSLQITGPTVSVVRTPDGFGGFTISVAFPFTLTGSLLAASLDDGTEYRLELLAQGRGSHSFFQEANEIVRYSDTSLIFEAEAPIPEPGTLLLVSTGVALAELRRRSQSARS